MVPKRNNKSRIIQNLRVVNDSCCKVTFQCEYCQYCDREVVCSASDRQGSNFESCVCRCHLNHLTIFKRFSWPSLDYMCIKVSWIPNHFIYHPSFKAIEHSMYVSGFCCTPVASISVIRVVLSEYRFIPLFVHGALLL